MLNIVIIHKNIYYFIDKFDRNEILSLDARINIIYRNYKEKNIDPIIKKIKETCNKNNRKFYITNDLKVALKFDLNGLYLSAFNNKLNYKNISSRKNFKIIGSAHNYKEIKIKEKKVTKSTRKNLSQSHAHVYLEYAQRL